MGRQGRGRSLGLIAGKRASDAPSGWSSNSACRQYVSLFLCVLSHSVSEGGNPGLRCVLGSLTGLIMWRNGCAGRGREPSTRDSRRRRRVLHDRQVGDLVPWPGGRGRHEPRAPAAAARRCASPRAAPRLDLSVHRTYASSTYWQGTFRCVTDYHVRCRPRQPPAATIPHKKTTTRPKGTFIPSALDNDAGRVRSTL